MLVDHQASAACALNIEIDLIWSATKSGVDKRCCDPYLLTGSETEWLVMTMT